MHGVLREVQVVTMFCALAALPAMAQDGGAPAAAMPLKDRLVLCATCHTPDGNSVIPENPVLAGLSASYLAQQMRDFKSGERKSAVMNAIILAVDESEFDALAAFFAAQTPKPTAKPPKGSAKLAKLGKPFYEDGDEELGVPGCAGCHEDDGSGSEKYPRLAGQHVPYVLLQLKNFKSGERANDRKEVMREVAKRMTEKQMREVAAYIATLGGTSP